MGNVTKMTLQETELISISFQIRDPASSSLIDVQSVRPCRSIYTGHNAATRPGNSHFVRKEAHPLLPLLLVLQLTGDINFRGERGDKLKTNILLAAGR